MKDITISIPRDAAGALNEEGTYASAQVKLLEVDGVVTASAGCDDGEYVRFEVTTERPDELNVLCIAAKFPRRVAL